MRAGFEYYRAVPEDTIQNLNYSKTKLTMPVLALRAGYHKYEGNVTVPLNIYSMEKLAQNVTHDDYHYQLLCGRYCSTDSWSFQCLHEYGR